ncbi:hypothetical protein ACQJBY_001135 [Aegilops geniculata]
MDWDILPRRAAWWPRCGSPMLCSDGPTLLDSFRWLSLIRFPVVACVEPWPTSPVAGASSSRPSCCLPNVLLLAASGCTISSVAASFDSSRFSSFLSTKYVRVLLSVSSVSCCLSW